MPEVLQGTESVCVCCDWQALTVRERFASGRERWDGFGWCAFAIWLKGFVAVLGLGSFGCRGSYRALNRSVYVVTGRH